ncbi:MAG: 2-phospho-L-lactate guanylyltransferase [Ktedonobacterales bacterium]|nr:2-phospho-L-lactate guanylyltransferase [Ktedonobacterales bacterium]
MTSAADASAVEAIAAVVPLHGLTEAKSRLRGVLADADRLALMRWLAERVLAALAESGVVARIAVVSPDLEVLAWAREWGAMALRQKWGGLNEGLEVGRRWALAEGAAALLIALGDLPLLTAAEVAGLAALAHGGGQAPLAVLAPDRVGRGTNALLLRPPSLLPFVSGEGSLARYQALARARGIEPCIYDTPGTRFDVDGPADLDELIARELWRPGALPRGNAAGGGRYDWRE